MRRAHPVRITLLFALAAIGALAVVWLLVQSLGLPVWVFVIAIALLITGLPIMLFASRAERQRLLRGTSLHVAPPTSLLGRLSTIRGAALGGVLAFAALALGAGSFMILRANGVGPFATLLTAGTITKDFPEGRKEHRFVRADTHASEEDAKRFMVQKAQRLIDEAGDRLFG